MLKAINLKVSVDHKNILNGLTLRIKPGEVHAIMGPNGSGKSTLAYVLAGHPKYEVKEERVQNKETGIWLDEVRLNDKTPDERARLGLFLAMQYPVAVPGLSTQSFLWQIYKSKSNTQDQKPKAPVTRLPNVVEFRKWLGQQAEVLGLNPELLKRSLNDGFSGGEKKKLEILQMLVSNPKYLILDEIDSGLDVDALKKIAKTVAAVAKQRQIGVILITHYSRILEYLEPDKVHIMKEGVIVESGGRELVNKIEKEGYGLEEAGSSND